MNFIWGGGGNFHVMYQLTAPKILQSRHSDMFRHDNVVFREYIPSLRNIYSRKLYLRIYDNFIKKLPCTSWVQQGPSVNFAKGSNSYSYNVNVRNT
jgi:hypothetical protein